MDSKLEEADTDFQGIADPGCKGLSNSSVESLNLYSCGSMSSTCDFKPLVETSSSDLLDYLDLHDSSQAESYQLGHGLTVDGESTAGCFETDSFVCIDVALETWEKAGKDTKTVPKRQIQLKRHNSKEPRVEGEGNIDAGNMSERKHMKDVCLRQHSFPAAVQEASCKTELQSVSGDRKQKLQKSLSLDETSSRTEMASCLIKSVLSKKMQYENDLQHLQVQEGDFSPSKVKNASLENSNFFLRRQTPHTKVTNLNLSFSMPITHNISSQEHLVKAKSDPLVDSIRQHDKTNSGTGNLKTGLKPGNMKTGKCDPGEEQAEIVRIDQGARPCSGLGKAHPGSTPLTSMQAPGIQSGMTNKATEWHAGLENHRQQSTKCFKPEISKITPIPCTTKENKKTSLDVALLPEQETQAAVSAEFSGVTVGNAQQTNDRENCAPEHASGNEMRGKNKPPTHKVRDLRKLVKHSYNLQFRGTDMPAQNHVFQNKLTVLSQAPEGAPLICSQKKEQKKPEESRLDPVAMPNHSLSSTKGRYSMSLFSKEKVNQADMRALTTAPGVPPNSTKASQPSPVASTAGLRCGSDPQVYSNCSAQPTQPLAKEAPARVKDGADHSLCTATLEPQPWHPSSPQGLVPLLSTEHGNEGTVTGSLVFEQSSGRMLLDPTTGKYFYITVPTQPLCKTLFDPETGQYVTVQVPQQTAVYPGLYSTCTTSYPFFHYQSLYAPPFLPFSAGYFGGPIPVANQL